MTAKLFASDPILIAAPEEFNSKTPTASNVIGAAAPDAVAAIPPIPDVRAIPPAAAFEAVI